MRNCNVKASADLEGGRVRGWFRAPPPRKLKFIKLTYSIFIANMPRTPSGKHIYLSDPLPPPDLDPYLVDV